jgi:hypothetical protein
MDLIWLNTWKSGGLTVGFCKVQGISRLAEGVMPVRKDSASCSQSVSQSVSIIIAKQFIQNLLLRNSTMVVLIAGTKSTLSLIYVLSVQNTSPPLLCELSVQNTTLPLLCELSEQNTALHYYMHCQYKILLCHYYVHCQYKILLPLLCALS